jgi:spore photoproduct lyase
MDCSYCILQAYFHPPVLQYFVNGDDLERELVRTLEKGDLRRIGTGEFTDSLIWNRWTDRCRWLVEFFGSQERAVLELKTKTADIEVLRHAKHQGKTVMAWSMNTPRIIRTEERGTASLEARLRAAGRSLEWGYPVAFHFDPLVIYPGCEADYREVIRTIFRTISPESIAWISLGSFRFMPALKALVRKRFPDSSIILGEFIPGLDGKMRYFRPLRLQLYQVLVEEILSVAPEATVYFCMEDEGIWEKCLGFRPSEKGGLDRILDRRAARLCGLAS